MEKAMTRKETYMQAIASGNTSDLPTPITREEKLLLEIAQRGGGGAVDPADITEAVNNYLKEHPVEGIGTMTKAEMLNILRGGDNA